MASGLSLVVGGGADGVPFDERGGGGAVRGTLEPPSGAAGAELRSAAVAAGARAELRLLGAEAHGRFPAADVEGCLPVAGGEWFLPEAGRATLVELFASHPRDGAATGFVLAQLRPGPLLWVQERMAILEAGRVYPPGLGREGHDLIHVEVRDARAALWAMEEGLRCGGLSAVIGEIWGNPASLDLTATRRLAVAAEKHGVAAYLVRLGGQAGLSGARFRWRVASAPSLANPLNHQALGRAAWDCELFRARGHPPGQWRVTHDRATDRFDLVAAPGDRALGEGEPPGIDRRAG